MLEAVEAQQKLRCDVESCCRDVVGVAGGTVEGCIQIPEIIACDGDRAVRLGFGAQCVGGCLQLI